MVKSSSVGAPEPEKLQKNKVGPIIWDTLYVANKMLHKATGEHFNKPGHKISDMLMTIIEKVHSDDPMVLSVREEHWIKRGNTKYRGINRNKG